MIKFTAYDPFIKQFRTDKGWRVTFEVSETDYDKIVKLPQLQGRELVVVVGEPHEYEPE